jgi:hypothetical protein
MGGRAFDACRNAIFSRGGLRRSGPHHEVRNKNGDN